MGYGARTRTLIATVPGVPQRFDAGCPQVVVKLYRGPALPYLRFHSETFGKLLFLVDNDRFQQTLDAGRHDGQTFAILQYVDGETLRDFLLNANALMAKNVRELILSLFQSIWIPCWNTGLRFKDCHQGNFIVTDNGLRMIDVEQIRKSAWELLEKPYSWQDRCRHEQSAIKQLPGLLCDLLQVLGQQRSKASLKREIRSALETTGLSQRLCVLGKIAGTSKPAEEARDAVTAIVDLLERKGVLS